MCKICSSAPGLITTNKTNEEFNAGRTFRIFILDVYSVSQKLSSMSIDDRLIVRIVVSCYLTQELHKNFSTNNLFKGINKNILNVIISVVNSLGTKHSNRGFQYNNKVCLQFRQKTQSFSMNIPSQFAKLEFSCVLSLHNLQIFFILITIIQKNQVQLFSLQSCREKQLTLYNIAVKQMNKPKQSGHLQGGGSFCPPNFVMYEKMKIGRQSYPQWQTMNTQEASYHDNLAKDYFKLANEYQKHKQYQLSVKFFQTALKYRYQSHEIHNNLGVVYVLRKQYSKALECFNKSLSLKSDQIFPKINLATLKLKQEDFLTSIQIFLQLMSRKPQDKRILSHYSRILNNCNIFYRFFKKMLTVLNQNIEKNVFQDSVSAILKGVAQNTPIIQSICSEKISFSPNSVSKILKIFQFVKLKYSNINYSNKQSILRKVNNPIAQIIEKLDSLDDEKLKQIISLFLAYNFLDEKQGDLCMEIYGKISKLNNPDIIFEYLNIFNNFLELKWKNLKNELKKGQNDDSWKRQHYSSKEIIFSIQRFFVKEQLYVYSLTDALKSGLRDDEYEIFVQCIDVLPNYQQLSANLHKKILSNVAKSHQKDKTESLMKAGLVQFLQQQQNPTKQTFNYPNIVKKIEEELEIGNNSFDRQISLVKYKLYFLFMSKKYDEAINLCRTFIKIFPKNQETFYQYLIAINAKKVDYEAALENLVITLTINPNNKEACFFAYSLLSQRKQFYHALRFLLRVLTANPTEFKYYHQLAYVYTKDKQSQQRIDDFIERMQNQFTRAIDFKVRANIALFKLLTQRQDRSYQYFKGILEISKAESIQDCQDLQLLYFIRMSSIYTNYYSYHEGSDSQKTEDELSCQIEAGFYLLIFMQSPFIFEVYSKETLQFDGRHYEYLTQSIKSLMLSGYDSIITQISKFSDEHKSVICSFIFRNIFKQDYVFNPIIFHNQIIKKNPQLESHTWVLLILKDIKEETMTRIRHFFDGLRGNKCPKYIMRILQSKAVTIKLKKCIRTFQRQKISQKGLEKLFQTLEEIRLLIFPRQVLQSNDPFYSLCVRLQLCMNQIICQAKKFFCSTSQKGYQMERDFMKTLQIDQICLAYGQFYKYFEYDYQKQKQFIDICSSYFNNENQDQFIHKLQNCIFDPEISEANSILNCHDFLDQHSLHSSNIKTTYSRFFELSNEGQKNKERNGQKIDKMFNKCSYSTEKFIREELSHLVASEEQTNHPSKIEEVTINYRLVINLVKLVDQLQENEIFAADLFENSFIVDDNKLKLVDFDCFFTLSNSTVNDLQIEAYESTQKVVKYYLSLFKEKSNSSAEEYRCSFTTCPKFRDIFSSIQADQSLKQIEKVQACLKEMKEKMRQGYNEFLQKIFDMLKVEKQGKKNQAIMSLITKFMENKLTTAQFLNKFESVCSKFFRKQQSENNQLQINFQKNKQNFRSKRKSWRCQQIISQFDQN